MKILDSFIVLLLFMSITGCTASHHAADVQEGLQGDKLTVGTVQREIKKGISGALVIEALGSPNIVSTDEQGREVWVYDKIATDRVYSSSSVGGGLGGGGINNSAGGLVILGGSAASGASSTSQRTLTIIIKFDHEKKVRDFAYHSSRF